MEILKIEEHVIAECSKAILLALKQRDEYTQLHSKRVVELSEELGLAIGLNQTEIKNLRISAAFHDIGKIGIPDKILLKPDSFDDEEWVIMQSHVLKSEELVKTMYFKNKNIISNSVRHHHEYYNGEGYPDKLKGEDIPIYSRIISLADSYDAMSMPRPYHEERKHDEIMEILESEVSIKSDPILFKYFKNTIKKSAYRIE